MYNQTWRTTAGLPGVTSGWPASGGVTTFNGTNYLNVISPTEYLLFRLQHP